MEGEREKGRVCRGREGGEGGVWREGGVCGGREGGVYGGREECVGREGCVEGGVCGGRGVCKEGGKEEFIGREGCVEREVCEGREGGFSSYRSCSNCSTPTGTVAGVYCTLSTCTTQTL